jgi:transposase
MQRKRWNHVRYSENFKRKVVEEIEEEGLTLMGAARRYGISGGSTVNRWVKQLGRPHLLSNNIYIQMKEEKDRIRELEEELKRLKIKLADVTIQNDVLESLISVAGSHYRVDLKKNFGGKQSATPKKKEGAR